MTSVARTRIDGGAAKVVYRVDSVGEQAAVSDPVRLRINRRHIVSGRRQYDRHAMREHECTRHDDKAASRLAPKGLDRRFDLCVANAFQSRKLMLLDLKSQFVGLC